MFQYTKAAAATMWLLGGGGGKKDDSESSSSKHSFVSRGSRRSGRGINHNGKKHSAPSRRRSRKKKVSNDEEGTSQTFVDKDCSVQMLTDETYSGIEVSLSNDAEVRVTSFPASTNESKFPDKTTVMSLHDQILAASRVQYAQFSLSNLSGTVYEDSKSPPSNDAFSNGSRTSVDELDIMLDSSPSEFLPGNHRLPLFQKGPHKHKSPMLFDDVLFLLRSHEVAGELTCVTEEITLMDEELAALEADRLLLEKLVGTSPVPASPTPSGSSHLCSGLHCDSTKTSNNWDFFGRLLLTTNSTLSKQSASQKEFLTPVQRTELQHRRGLNFSYQLPDNKAHEALLAKCGCKTSVLRKTLKIPGSATPRANDKPAASTISPQNCRDGGAAATVQHFAMWKGAVSPSTVSSASSGDNACSFLLSRDSAKSYCHGSLPPGLLSRMQKEKQAMRHGDAQRYSMENILYLATGPFGCYYASFRSGECWWGCVINKVESNNSVNGFNDLESIFREWDIYRIAFGPEATWDDRVSMDAGVNGNMRNSHGTRRQKRADDSTATVSLSWIVVGRDGRVAWKNVPARLHHLLSNRASSAGAPTEVALGCGDAYFVKFLDGTSRQTHHPPNCNSRLILTPFPFLTRDDGLAASGETCCGLSAVGERGTNYHVDCSQPGIASGLCDTTPLISKVSPMLFQFSTGR
jgi:hypothetical protein